MLKITRMTSELTRSEAVRDAATAGIPSALADLGALVRIPSVAFPGFDPAPVRRSAEAVKALVDATGLFETVTIADAEIPGTGERGMPAVLASRPARNGRPTILLYAHHDVQPVGDEALWESPPFEPTVRGGRLYGRGAADDKAGIMAHIGALRAVKEAIGDDLDLGVALFFEGEEEAGSLSFSQFLADHADALRADVIVVADSGNWDARTPALTVSLRGNAKFRLRVRTLEHASHSGHVRGSGARRDDGHREAPRHAVGRRRRRRRRRARRTGCRRPPSTARRRCATRPGLPAGVSPIGRGTILEPHLEQAVDHGDRDRRAQRRERVQHADARGHRRDQRPRGAWARRRATRTPRSRPTCARTRRSAPSWSSRIASSATRSSSTPAAGR